VDNLPQSLTELRFFFDFNQPVDNLPSSLSSLALSNLFNQPLDHLPASLTSLSFGNFYHYTKAFNELAPDRYKYNAKHFGQCLFDKVLWFITSFFFFVFPLTHPHSTPFQICKFYFILLIKFSLSVNWSPPTTAYWITAWYTF
jgi:hypothetical protein